MVSTGYMPQCSIVPAVAPAIRCTTDDETSLSSISIVVRLPIEQEYDPKPNNDESLPRDVKSTAFAFYGTALAKLFGESLASLCGQTTRKIFQQLNLVIELDTAMQESGGFNFDNVKRCVKF